VAGISVRSLPLPSRWSVVRGKGREQVPFPGGLRSCFHAPRMLVLVVLLRFGLGGYCAWAFRPMATRRFDWEPRQIAGRCLLSKTAIRGAASLLIEQTGLAGFCSLFGLLRDRSVFCIVFGRFHSWRNNNNNNQPTNQRFDDSIAGRRHDWHTQPYLPLPLSWSNHSAWNKAEQGAAVASLLYVHGETFW